MPGSRCHGQPQSGFQLSHLTTKKGKAITFLSLEAVCLPDVLTVKPKVLGEGLSHKQLKALRDKVTDGPGIFIQVAGGKALVSRVEEHKKFPPLKSGNMSEQRFRLWNSSRFGFWRNLRYLHDLRDLLPLLLSWVSTSGVVCTCMEDKDGVFWSFLWRR